ncbi:MAG: ABC transporter substrate-binding protein [Verrucomicrobia bacterium]|nr:ABC transporter substrate-binding protein [Verrucomicrobiota bacterium]
MDEFSSLRRLRVLRIRRLRSFAMVPYEGMRRMIVLICGCATALALPGFAQIHLGEVDPLSGGVSQFGIGCHNGITLALEQVNANGGVAGQKVDLISEDDQSKPGQSATAVRKLITQDHVLAILGDATSSATLESAPIAQQARVPMITPSATNPRITEIGDYIFRVCFLDEFQGRVIARFAHDRLKVQKLALLTDVKQDYSVDLARFFKEEFTRLGGTVVREQSYATGDTDFRAQLTAIRAVKPDALYVPGYYAEVALSLKQLRQFGMAFPVLGCDGWANQTLLSVAGKAAENTYFTNHFSPDDPAPAVQRFVQAYRQKYGQMPDTFGALGYDAAMILTRAIERAAAKIDSETVRNALAETRDYPGVTGGISFDAQRNASKPALVITVKDGKFEIVERIAP